VSTREQFGKRQPTFSEQVQAILILLGIAAVIVSLTVYVLMQIYSGAHTPERQKIHRHYSRPDQ
jgi:hypothetical protein